jgi:hypothetical protein
MSTYTLYVSTHKEFDRILIDTSLILYIFHPDSTNIVLEKIIQNTVKKENQMTKYSVIFLSDIE